ncbi:hypothetical protein B0T14DRAFT_495251 [Immersiella caudata]|uniref:DUF7580 domain-containing protein n=1 Tax=Immersiella caudata TaxID=314043 RepID=A0AA39WYT7_9PEZI|nr:hypothetical protein B0T14DRAFT_495251 [Immersiella caudata]
MNQLQCRTVKSDLGNATAFSLVVPLGGNDVQPAWATAFLVDMTEEEAEQQRHDGMGTVVTPPKRPAVRFGTPTDKRAVSQQQAQKEKAVKDMCGLAAEALESQRPLRLRLFANALTIQTVATSLPVDMTPFDKVLTVTTLGDALAQAPQQRSGCIWHTPKRQSLLAVDIASSVLQLQRTDWLCAPWSSQTIHFIIGTCAGKEKVGVFIRGDLIGSRTTNVDLTGTVPDTDPHVVVLELAILLLELWHRKSIEAWASSPANGAQLNTSDIDSRHIAVIRWLRATHFSLPVPYLEVIEYCLRVYSGRPQSWDDEQFAQRYCQNIIMPLLQSSKVWPDG